MKRVVPVLAVIVMFFAGPGAGSEPAGPSASAAAGAFTPSADLPRGARAETRMQNPSAESERWVFYRDFWFDYDSSRIDATDSSKVADVAGYLKQNPTFRLALDGAMDNADLSDRRVDSVRQALVAAGVPAYKIYTGEFGDPRLRRERRVEVLFSSSH